MAPASGALPPHEASQATLETGEEHLSEPLIVTFIQNIYGAMLISSGGLFSILLGAGFSGIENDNNPGIQLLMQGVAFPFGLMLVYLVGAELFTGYPMWYTMTALERKGSPLQYVRGVIACWTGNLVGALIFSAVFTKATGAISEEPWRSVIVNQVRDDIIELEWHVVFLRAIGCGWLVTVAMFLGTQNRDGISKALYLHFPFMISATARFPHTVEYMYLVSSGMMLGSPLSVGGFIWKCLIPVTLGNTVGGAITGAHLWWVHIHGQRRGKHRNNGNGSLLDDE